MSWNETAEPYLFPGTSCANFKESIKMLLQNREYYNKNKETLTEEAKKQKELEISQRISYFDKELKEYKEKLKKLNQVIDKNGGQAKLF